MPPRVLASGPKPCGGNNHVGYGEECGVQWSRTVMVLTIIVWLSEPLLVLPWKYCIATKDI